MGELLHRQGGQHVAQGVMDVSAQLPVRLPIQHAEQNPLQACLADVKIWTKRDTRIISTHTNTLSHCQTVILASRV